MVPRKIQEFRIEPESFDGLLLEYYFAFFPAERLKAALRVHERQAQDYPHNPVEDYSRKLPEFGFVHLDQFPVYRTRTDRHVIGIHFGEQLVRFFDRRRKIRIRKQDNLAPGFQGAKPDAKSLPAVPPVRN